MATIILRLSNHCGHLDIKTQKPVILSVGKPGFLDVAHTQTLGCGHTSDPGFDHPLVMTLQDAVWLSPCRCDLRQAQNSKTLPATTKDKLTN